MVKRASLKDIANKVGVSSALVSYVLNDKQTGRINKQVALRIRNTAKELNYRTNQIARSLKTSKTYTIGLIVSDISVPFSSSLARIIEDEADKDNYTVLFGSSDENPLKSQKLIDTFLNRHVDGLIIAPGEHTESQIIYLQQQEIPFVLIDRYFPFIETNYVTLDNFGAAYDAIDHLAEEGYKNIGLINFQSGLTNLKERTNGYTAALGNNSDIPQKKYLREIAADTEHVEKNVENAINELLSLNEPVDALLFATNDIAIHGLNHINRLKIKVPRQLAIISFDEMAAWDFFYAPLTYIKQPLQKMGKLSAKILLDSIADNKNIQQVKLQSELIIRAPA